MPSSAAISEDYRATDPESHVEYRLSTALTIHPTPFSYLEDPVASLQNYNNNRENSISSETRSLIRIVCSLILFSSFLLIDFEPQIVILEFPVFELS